MIKKLLKEFTKFNNNIRKEKLSFIKTYASFSFSFLKHGSSPNDFFRYDFFKKDNKEKSIYMTYRRNQKVINKYNNKKNVLQFENKYLFNQTFSEFINREYLYSKNITKDSLKDFISKHKEVIVKPLSEGQGRGIFKIKEYDLDEQIDYLIANNYLIEEVIIPQKNHRKSHMYCNTTY